ncbi:MAG TPA: tRNA-binding protein [Anaerolineales bacterium]|nr:tRNA-binding protein [Anaerolineales bacterium]
MPTISYSDFAKVEMRVGRIIAVEDFPEARKPAYKLTIDFGPYGIKRSSAQVTNYTKQELLDRLVVAVTNFPPKQIGPFKSEVLVLGAINADDAVILLKPDEGAELGRHIA